VGRPCQVSFCPAVLSITPRASIKALRCVKPGLKDGAPRDRVLRQTGIEVVCGPRPALVGYFQPIPSAALLARN
jgi:hypothetical protein